MNLSGEAVGQMARYFGIEADRIVVVHDEMDLPLGRIKWKRGGGAGGHKGVRSVTEHLGTGDFWRLRLGVGRPRGKATSHVLGTFSEGDEARAVEMAEEGAQLLRLFLRDGPKAVGDRLAQKAQAEKQAAQAGKQAAQAGKADESGGSTDDAPAKAGAPRAPAPKSETDERARLTELSEARREGRRKRPGGTSED